MSAELRARFDANLHRVSSILWFPAVIDYNLQLHDSSVRSQDGPVADDLIRAAVVLLHATLEDFLRNVAAGCFPRGDAEILRDIPLVGTSDHRKTKFDLGDLVRFMGNPVEQVIEESIIAHLDRSNFNNIGDIKAHLRTLKLSDRLVDPHARHIAAMINRRHLIAHRADHDDADPDRHQLRPIARGDVLTWIEAVRQFGIGTLGDIDRGQS